MTVMKPAANISSQDRNNSGFDLHETNEFLSPGFSVNPIHGKYAGQKASERESDRVLFGKWKGCGEVETDQESTGSSEEMDSPKSVAKVRTWPRKNFDVYMHSQILRIREEDSHLGDDIGEGLSATDKLAAHHVVPRVDVILFSKPILPASPLSGKTAIKTVH